MKVKKTKFVCDTESCKSFVELSSIEDINDPDKALMNRGWTVIHSDESPDQHLCPYCSNRPVTLAKE